MKYAKFSDDFLSNFRLDDNGETLVLTDKRGYTRGVKLLPCEEKSYAMGYQDGLEDGLQDIRPQGKWIDHSDDYGYVECPFCHELTNCEGNPEELHYCWKCGAENCGVQMKGGKDDES